LQAEYEVERFRAELAAKRAAAQQERTLRQQAERALKLTCTRLSTAVQALIAERRAQETAAASAAVTEAALERVVADAATGGGGRSLSAPRVRSGGTQLRQLNCVAK